MTNSPTPIAVPDSVVDRLAKDTAVMPVVDGTHMGELVNFDYKGRGYNLRWK